ncbi:MAG: serine hydrolase domain-containing protein [Bacteroidia bacterium]
MKKLLLSLSVVLFCASLTAQEFDRAKMDSLFSLIDENGKGMYSVAIFQDGKEVYSNAIGYADREQQIAATPETRYRIGSISKTFTAVLVMQLVEQGKLSLDTRLSEFYPKIPNAEKITIEHLLRHRSGIYNFTIDPEYADYMEEPISKKKLVKIISKYDSDFEPGAKYSYSNSGYVLLSFIIEELSGKSYADLLQQSICTPCTFENTYFGGKIDPGKKEARSYEFANGWKASTETDMSVPQGAGALVSTPRDLNRFFNCLFDYKLVNEESIAKMTDLRDNYGFGLFEFPFYSKKAIGHNGGIDGFVSSAGYFPEEKTSVALITNGTLVGMNDVMIGVLSIYFGKEYNLPKFKPSVPISSEALDAYTGTYSSPDFPLKIKIRNKDGAPYGQATGQSEFPLEYIGEDQFQFLQADLVLKFDPKAGKMTLRQGGGSYVLTKE